VTGNTRGEGRGREGRRGESAIQKNSKQKTTRRNCKKHSHSWRFLLPLPWPLSAVQREQRKRMSASLPKPPSPILHPLVPFCSQLLTDEEEEEEEQEELQRHHHPAPPPSPSSLLRCYANTKTHGKKQNPPKHTHQSFIHVFNPRSFKKTELLLRISIP
jgi:hypothetical protein